MVFRFFSVFFLIFILNSNANSECAFTDEITGGQEGFTNDAGICITRVHRQVFRLTVKCRDYDFEQIIWDGAPRVGDFIDTLGCNSLTFRSYTRRQNDYEELVTGCMVIYEPVLYENGWKTRPGGPISEHKNWDFSLINSRGSYCTQPADSSRYLVRPGQQSSWRSLDDTAFITALYESILDRTPDPAGLKHWIGLLENGKSRESVMSWFFKSPEYKIRDKNDYGYVRDLYQAIHSREPSPDEAERSLNKLSKGNSRQQLLDSKINSNKVDRIRGQGRNNPDNHLSCKNNDNEEKGCCCFKGTHTYRFKSQYVSSVLVRFDTGKKFNCKSKVHLQINSGKGWKTIKTIQAISSSGNSTNAPIDVGIPVNGTISGVRISDGCVCCLDFSEIFLK